MNQKKIGSFIAACRKNKGLTQLQLADKLSITDKAISKWERGITMPDTAIMLQLCAILDISVNELLRGEKINMENHDTKNEQLLLEMAREVEQKNKIIWNCMWIMMTISIIALLAGLLLSKFLIPEGVLQLVAIIVITVVFLIPCFYALKLEVSVGSYKCKKCAHELVPTYKHALNAPHMGTTRYMFCPQCQRRTWFKKSIKK